DRSFERTIEPDATDCLDERLEVSARRARRRQRPVTAAHFGTLFGREPQGAIDITHVDADERGDRLDRQALQYDPTVDDIGGQTRTLGGGHTPSPLRQTRAGDCSAVSIRVLKHLQLLIRPIPGLDV